MDALSFIADHYRRIAKDQLPGEDQYAFDASKVESLIPTKDNIEFVGTFVDTLFAREIERRTAVSGKYATLLSAAGLSGSVTLAATGVLVNSSSNWAIGIAIILMLSSGAFAWSAIIAMTGLRLQAITIPQNPLDFPGLIKSDDRELVLARRTLQDWSTNQDVTNQIAFLYQDALERYLFALVGLFISAVGVVVILVAA